ncbi:MAG: AmmeMemoRadiSam system protein B [Chloroflexia bacterium]
MPGKAFWSLGVFLALLLVGCGGAPPTARPSPTLAAGPIRPPAVAGQFYPADPGQLAAMVDGFLEGIEPTPGRPIGLIVPHAGYIYSGPVAAYAYAELRGLHYDAVILIGPNHRLADFTGIGVYPAGAFQTPLGTVPVDAELARAILEADPSFQSDPQLHALEHSLEVQLPFLQRVLPDTPIVPILIGMPTQENARALTAALSRVLPGCNVLLIGSTDLSHYPPYEEAVRVDQALLAAIATLDVGEFRREAARSMSLGIPNLQTPCCGQQAVAVVMEVSRVLGADRATILHYANSGDVPEGRRDQVVGYGAVKFWASK